MNQNTHPLFTQALNYHQAGNTAAALELYEKILAENPDDTNVLHLTVILYAQEKKYQLALDFIERALAIAPSATLYNSAGNIYKNLQQIESAIKHYHQSLALQPNASAHNNLGIIYYQLQQYDQAKQHYQAAIKIDPNCADAYFNLGLVAQLQNDFIAATNYFDHTLKSQPQHLEAHYQLALIFQQQEENLKAIKHYQKILRLACDHIEAHHNLGALLINQGKLNQALRHFKKILLLDPSHADSYHNIGTIFLKQKNPEAALKYFLRLAQLTKNFTSYYNLGVIYFDLGLYQDAIIYFNEALKLDSENHETCINLAAIYLKLEDYVNAIKYYEKVLAIDPYNKETQYLLAALTKKSNPITAPSEYIQHLFDNYAEHFDQHLEILEYKAPQLLYDATIKTCRDIKNWNILDLGCGTGLCGEKFKSLANKLIGIDLSPKMIEIAKQKNVYNQLQVGDIASKMLDYNNIDLIIASDTLVYIGDLHQIFMNCSKILKPNGWFVFTIEPTDIYPYLLQKTARFAHCEKYIEELSIKNNFTIALHNKITARKQKGINVIQDIFIIKI